MLETPTRKTNHILLTFDIEDWFQVENFKPCITFSSWAKRELRVERNTHHILDLLDSIPLPKREASRVSREREQLGSQHRVLHPNCNKHANDELDVSRSESLDVPSQTAFDSSKDEDGKPRATFFFLGWIAQRIPQLVREVKDRGHEVASHGFHHRICYEESSEELRKDLEDSKKLLENLIGSPIYGYRAPSFSVDSVVLRTAEDCGYLYDSSFNSFGLHDRYGQLDLSKYKKHGIAAEVSNRFYEMPISNLEMGRRIVPWGGGGYFRLIPFPLFKLGARLILRKEGAYLFYLHSWELDPHQPRVQNVPMTFRFRHYVNLSKAVRRISMLAESFAGCQFITCRQYLERVIPRNGIESER